MEGHKTRPKISNHVHNSYTKSKTKKTATQEIIKTNLFHNIHDAVHMDIVVVFFITFYVYFVCMMYVYNLQRLQCPCVFVQIFILLLGSNTKIAQQD